MGEYTEKQKEYIDSVAGNAHASAVKIIGELEAENKLLKALLARSLTINEKITRSAAIGWIAWLGNDWLRGK